MSSNPHGHPFPVDVAVEAGMPQGEAEATAAYVSALNEYDLDASEDNWSALESAQELLQAARAERRANRIVIPDAGSAAPASIGAGAELNGSGV
jgi:hypothetical protein